MLNIFSTIIWNKCRQISLFWQIPLMIQLNEDLRDVNVKAVYVAIKALCL